MTGGTPATGLTDAETDSLNTCPICGCGVHEHTHLTRSIRASNPEARKVCDRSVRGARAAAVERILAARAKPAPSGDEREALAETICRAAGCGSALGLVVADAVMDAGFRAVASPAPSGDAECDCGTGGILAEGGHEHWCASIAYPPGPPGPPSVVRNGITWRYDAMSGYFTATVRDLPSEVSPAPSGAEAALERVRALACHDCGLLYGAPGWCDCHIPDDVWLRISPTGHEGGVLCISCIAARLVAADIEGVPLKVTSGPWDWADRRAAEGDLLAEAERRIQTKVAVIPPHAGQDIAEGLRRALAVIREVRTAQPTTDGANTQIARQRAVLEVISEHRRVNNVRRCSAGGCAWRPTRSGRNGDEAAMLERHAAFNAHLADLIVDRLAEL